MEPTSGIGAINPFRYRGYIYDAETGFYYVSSRYYDPETGRFINADTTAVLTASPMSLTDKNLFSYCDNNPVCRADSNGQFWHVVVGAAVGFASQYVSNVIGGMLSGESFVDALKIEKADIPGLVGASLSGALAATGIPTVGLTLADAAINSATYIAECEITGQEATTSGLIYSVGIGAISDIRGKGGIDGKNLKGIYSTSTRYITKSKSVKKISMYTAKKVAIRNKVFKEVRSTFRSTIVTNNWYSAYKYVRRLCK